MAKIVTLSNSKKCVGATLIEYSLLLAMIVLIIMGAMRLMGESASQQFSVVGSTLSD